MKVLSDLTLDNSLKVKIIDHSRRVAADRWFVKIVCEVKMSLADEHFAGRQEDEPELHDSIRRLLGDEINMEIVKERNFIDETVVEDVKRKIIEGIDENISGYLSADSFPERFLASRYEEAHKRAVMGAGPTANECHEDDDDGPADFSSCFRD